MTFCFTILQLEATVTARRRSGAQTSLVQHALTDEHPGAVCNRGSHTDALSRHQFGAYCPSGSGAAAHVRSTARCVTAIHLWKTAYRFDAVGKFQVAKRRRA